MIIASILAGNYTSHKMKEELVCESNEVVMHCAQISDTNKTCYPHFHDFDNRKVCYEGWVLVE